MKLTSIDGNEFELKILGYQFPAIGSDKWDSNWLMIYILARDTTHEWESTDPCMDTYEAEKLCGWLRHLAEGNETKPALDFIEPEIEFEVEETSPEQVILRVRCCYFVSSHDDTQIHRIESGFRYNVEREQLRLAAQEWCAEIQQYPTRKRRES